MPNYCMVSNCKAFSSRENDRMFHLLPLDPQLCAAWLDAIGFNNANNMKKRTSYRVCSDHFDEACYKTKRVLRCDARPTLRLGREGPDGDTSEPQQSTSRGTASVIDPADLAQIESISDTAINLYDAEIQIKDEFLEKHLNDNDDTEFEEDNNDIEVEEDNLKKEFGSCSQEGCGKFLGSKSLELVKCQMLLKTRTKQNDAVKFKLFCLDLYYHNPQAYEFLKQLINLPSIRTLRKIYVSVHAGYISPQCLQMMDLMLVNMNATDRCCVVGIGSTNIRKHVYYDIKNDTFHGLHQTDDKPLPKLAKKAYVLVVKGLFSKWRLPVAYALFGEYDCYALVDWADTVIETLMRKGFDVRAFISNQDDEDFKRASQLNGISRRKNFFHVNNKIIYHIFDVRHLLKSLRDSFMSFDFIIGGRDIAKWDHILSFHNARVGLQTQLASKLTEGHVKPDETQQKSTVYAAQLFSHSVATAMDLFIKLKLIDEGAVATVKLINGVNDLFDLLNSHKVKHDSVYKRAYTGEKLQEMFLEKVIEYFQSIKKDTKGKDVNTRDEVEAIEGFIVTIHSVKDLWKDLKQDRTSYLLTRSLNLEFIDDFFRKLNPQNKTNSKQCNEFTSIEFNRLFYKSFVAHIIDNSKLNKSTKIATVLSKLNKYMETKTMEGVAETRVIVVGDPDYRIALPEINVIRFIAGYLMRKALDEHRTCKTFMLYLTPTRSMTKIYYLSYQYFEDNSKKFESLRLPEQFIDFVMKLEEIFLKVFTTGTFPDKVGAIVLKAMANLTIRPCSCFPLLHIKKLFVRLRIYNTMKIINKQLRVNRGNLHMFELMKLDF